MKKSINIFLIIVILSLFSGWACPLDSLGDIGKKVPGKISGKTQNNKSVFHSSYSVKKAKTYKNNDELQLALFFLKIAASLSSDNMKIVEKKSVLKRTIDNKSNRYFKQGKEFYIQNKIEKARKQFLTALRYKPDHKGALDYLKNKLIPKEHINYIFRKNDSLKNISNKFYNDPEMVFLIVYFNGLTPDTELKPGEILKIPMLEPEFNQIIGGHRQYMVSAKNLLVKKRFQEVVVITQKILKNDPKNIDAIKLKNEAFYQIGMKLCNQEKYFEAIDTFKKITPEYEGVNGVIQEAIKHELKKAENLLKEKKYEKSIDLAEKILSYDQTNTAAKKLISVSFCRKGKSLLIRKKFAEALNVLDKADSAEDCVEKIRLAVKKAKKQQAEVHYIQGVKHFLNEELEGAIKEWEKALELNPAHDKAKKNIKNARSLLEKLKKVK